MLICQEGEAVLEKYGFDGSIYYLYTNALFAFIREGASSVATAALAQAIQLFPSTLFNYLFSIILSMSFLIYFVSYS
jgi:hypothetical protein